MNKEWASQCLNEGQALLLAFYQMAVSNNSAVHGEENIVVAASSYCRQQMALATEYARKGDVYQVWEILRPLANTYRLLMHDITAGQTYKDGSLILKTQLKYWRLEELFRTWQHKASMAPPEQQVYALSLDKALSDFRSWSATVELLTDEYRQNYAKKKSLFYNRRPSGGPKIEGKLNLARLRRSIAAVLSPYYPLLLPEIDAALSFDRNPNAIPTMSEPKDNEITAISEIGHDFVYTVGVWTTSLYTEGFSTAKPALLLQWLMNQNEEAYEFRRTHPDIRDYGPHHPEWGRILCQTLLQADEYLQRPFSVQDLLDRVVKYTPPSMHGPLGLTVSLGICKNIGDLSLLGDFMSSVVEKEWHTLIKDADQDSLLLGAPFIPTFDPVNHPCLSSSTTLRFVGLDLNQEWATVSIGKEEEENFRACTAKYHKESWNSVYETEESTDEHGLLRQRVETLLSYLAARNKYALANALKFSFENIGLKTDVLPPYRPLLESGRIFELIMHPSKKTTEQNACQPSKPMKFHEDGENQRQVWHARLAFFSACRILGGLGGAIFAPDRLKNVYESIYLPSDMLPLIQWCGIYKEASAAEKDFLTPEQMGVSESREPVFPRSHAEKLPPFKAIQKSPTLPSWTNNGVNRTNLEVLTLPSPMRLAGSPWTLTLRPEKVEDLIRIMWKQALATSLFDIVKPEIMSSQNPYDESEPPLKPSPLPTVRKDIGFYEKPLISNHLYFHSDTVMKFNNDHIVEPDWEVWALSLKNARTELLRFADSFQMSKLKEDLAYMEWLDTYTPEETISNLFAHIRETPVAESNRGDKEAFNAWMSINPFHANPSKTVSRYRFHPNSLNLYMGGTDALLLQQYDGQYRDILAHRQAMNSDGLIPSLAGMHAFDSLSLNFSLHIRAQVEFGLSHSENQLDDTNEINSISF